MSSTNSTRVFHRLRPRPMCRTLLESPARRVPFAPVRKLACSAVGRHPQPTNCNQPQ
ncbi:hypothetical protein LY76DRAFT_599186 [Colletotrichum caudatum]|nr:hypothetical protein LY76DRAFT_599186 [Colletotrichum caudatum]